MSYGPSGCPWARFRQIRLMEVVRAQDWAVLRLRESTSDPVICTRGIRYGPLIVFPLSLYESETSTYEQVTCGASRSPAYSEALR